MKIICDCQLSKNKKDYVWCYDDEMNDFDDGFSEDYIKINIAPKVSFHWDQHLSDILNLPISINEINEGMFEIQKNIAIPWTMKSHGINYSEDLNDLINNQNHRGCKCENCNMKTIRYKMQYISDNIKCSSGYKHMKVIVSDIKSAFNYYYDINLNMKINKKRKYNK